MLFYSICDFLPNSHITDANKLDIPSPGKSETPLAFRPDDQTIYLLQASQRPCQQNTNCCNRAKASCTWDKGNAKFMRI